MMVGPLPPELEDAPVSGGGVLHPCFLGSNDVLVDFKALPGYSDDILGPCLLHKPDDCTICLQGVGLALVYT